MRVDLQSARSAVNVLAPPPLGPAPSWTSSDFTADAWRIKRASSHKSLIDFRTIPEGFRILAKYYLWALEYITDRRASTCARKAPSTFHRYFIEFRHIARELDRRGIPHLMQLDRETLIDLMRSRLKLSGKSSFAITSLRSIWVSYRKLYVLGPACLGVLPDGFLIDLDWETIPLDFDIVAPGSTRLIEDQIASALVNVSIEVLSYAKDIILCRDIKRMLRNERLGRQGQLGDLRGMTIRREALEKLRLHTKFDLSCKRLKELNKTIVFVPDDAVFCSKLERTRLLYRHAQCILLRSLISACYIIFAALTGFRFSEIVSIRKGDIVAIGNRAVVTTLITKTTGRADGVPVRRTAPLLLVEIHDILVRLSGASDRAQPLWCNTDGGILDNMHLNMYLQQFTEGAIKSNWRLRTHQFRKFFAIFCVRKNKASEDALRRHFRHVSADSINYYLKDKNAMKYMLDAEKVLAAEIYQDLIHDRRKYVSQDSNPILSTAMRYRARNLPIAEIERGLEAALSAKFTRVRPTLWGYCVVQPHDSAGAVCGGQHGVPATERVFPENCVRCKHLVAGKENREFLVQWRATHLEVCNSALSTKIARAASESAVDDANALLQRFDAEV